MKDIDKFRASTAAWRLKGRDAYADFSHQQGLSDERIAEVIASLDTLKRIV